MPSNDGLMEISAHYLGPALEGGRIDLFVLSDSLRGLGRLTNRVSYLMFGTQYEFRLEIDEGIRSGSIIIPLHIFNAIETALSSKGVQALATLMGLLGWGIGPATLSLYKLFKKKRGLPITDSDDLARLLSTLENIERLLLIKIYNDQEVQTALRAILRPLRVQGIEEFQTRRHGMLIDSVVRGDLQAADEAEASLPTEVEESVLDIEKVALVPHLAWHFSDGAKTFDAKITDPVLWARVTAGDRFGLGDRMRVELHTSFSRDAAGRLTIERVIPKVIEVEHAPHQPPLWPDDGRNDISQ